MFPMIVFLLVTGALLSGGEAGISDRFNEKGQSGNKPSQTQTGPVEQTTKAAFNFFDGELLQAVSNVVQGNFVISPASIKTLLGLVLEAATGMTLDDLKFALRLTNNTERNRQLMTSLHEVLQKMTTSQVEVDSETNVFLSKDLTFNTSYTKTISDIYKAGVDSVDFKSENAANIINSWVRTQTRGKIPSVVEPGLLDPDTMAVLVNAVYFDARWKKQFWLKDTSEDCFYSEPNLACTKVPIMFKEEELNYKYDKDLSSHIVQIPYQDERFSMVLVVPSARNGIRRIARDISKLTFPALVNKTKSTEVHLRLPRFTADFGADVKMILTKMGLGKLFSEEANIPFLINNNQARISAMVHKAKIDVNEKGTKAAAATGASVVPLMSGNDPVLVTADHPFYFFIYEMESESVLFSGRVSYLDGRPGVGIEENYDNLTPLSGGENRKPSQAPTNYRPPGSSRPSRPSFSSSQKPIFLGNDNHPYSVGPKPVQPSPTSNSNPIEFSSDHGADYLTTYARDHNQRSIQSHRRTRPNLNN